MEPGLGSVLPVDESDREGDAESIGVLKGHGAFKPDHVVCRGNVVVGSLQGLLHHLDDGGLPTTERHLGLVVEHQLVGGARPADRVDVPSDAPLEKIPLPIGRVRDQGAVLKVDESLGYGKDRHGRVKMGQHLVEEPVHSER